jgi:FxsC-like protein
LFLAGDPSREDDLLSAQDDPLLIATTRPYHGISAGEANGTREMKSTFTHQPHLAVFVIETAAPTTRTAGSGHDPRGYGETSTEWCPFPRQELPLAQYAGQVAERLDFKAEVSGIKTVRDPAARGPGLILIDPWFIADEDGRCALESAVAGLPAWVLPLLILDHPDNPRERELADQVRDILGAAGALPTNSSRLAASGVSSLDDFVSMVPVLVAEAERQYLRHRRKRVASSPSAGQPNSRHTTWPQGPVSTPDPLGEAPDA